MSGNFAIKGGGVGRLITNAILNFHFDFLNTSLRQTRDSDGSPLVDLDRLGWGWLGMPLVVGG